MMMEKKPAAADRPDAPGNQNREINPAVRRRTLKSFLWFGAASLVPVGVWRWVRAQPPEEGLPRPFRRVLDANAALTQALVGPARLVPTFPVSKAVRQPRVNGSIGLPDDNFDVSAWKLRVENATSPGRRPTVREFTLDDLKALPRTELVFEFKCIEGWSQIQHWGGAKFSDFAAKYGLGTRSGKGPDLNHPGDLMPYVGMRTPDGAYYVGLDMPSALHPQTLLCYELNGVPLPPPHGAPLRLVIPVKYGVKSLKRIGTLQFSDTRPPDYWAERGYDYSVGL